jgi:hypothetical protein
MFPLLRQMRERKPAFPSGVHAPNGKARGPSHYLDAFQETVVAVELSGLFGFFDLHGRISLAENWKQECVLRAFAKLFARMNDKSRGLLIHMASKMADRAQSFVVECWLQRKY